MTPIKKDTNNIAIDQFHPHETEALVRLYVDLFHDREPFTKCLGLGRDRMDWLARSIYAGANKRPLSKGFCRVARDRYAADKEVGFIVCDDLAAEENHPIPEDISETDMDIFLLWKDLPGGRADAGRK